MSVTPEAMFEPVPSFTWGKRAKVACANNLSQCQIAEQCDADFCKVTWPHLDVAADDKPLHYQSSSIAVVGDLDRDCTPEIVFNTYRDLTITSDGVLRAIRGDTGAKVWTNADPAWRTNSIASPAIGDLDGDGFAEVVVEGQGKTVLAFGADGKGLWKSDPFKGAPGSGAVAIANIDNDGAAEVVFGAALYSSKGKMLYEGVPGIGLNGQGPISCIADLDGDGFAEVVIEGQGKTVLAFKSDGTGLWKSVPFKGATGSGAVAIANIDSDGEAEVVFGAALFDSKGKLLYEGVPGIGLNGQGPISCIADLNDDGRPADRRSHGLHLHGPGGQQHPRRQGAVDRRADRRLLRDRRF